MIQILGLRPYFDNKTGTEKLKDEFFARNWRAPSVIDLLENYETYLEKIPANDRYNIFFTQYQAGSKRRAFSEQWVIPFDIDGVDPSLMPEMESEAKRTIANPYLELVCKTLGLKIDETGAIFTGHGLHLIVALKSAFTSATFFTDLRPHYNAVCNKLNFELAKAGLPGALDPGIFNQGVIGFRMPGTENRKEKDGKQLPPVPTRLLQRKIVPVEFDLTKHSGIPLVSGENQVKTHKFFKVDTKAVLSGCDFLKHTKEHPNSVNENEWYAMLSIVGRCEDGTKLAHEYSQGHKGYSHADTEEKLERALVASGPRTCKNINDIWGKCKDCPNFEKVKSPFVLKGEGYIETQDSGFHTVVEKDGVLRIGKPCYKDLRLFFERDSYYKSMGGGCYKWNGTHYEYVKEEYLENYAQTHFNPYVETKQVTEFRNLILRTNLVDVSWFQDTTFKKINLKNGILDLRTGDLGPHSRDIGFRYCLPYDYDQYAKAPLFEKYLKEVTCGDQDLEDLLLEFLGYAFSGDTYWLEVSLVLTGKGANGKSVLLHLLRKLAGKDNYSSITWKHMNNQVNLQGIDGKLFNLAEETPKSALYDATLFKNLTGGGEATVKRLYQDPYSIENKAKLIWACNELPDTDDTTVGFFRRFIIVPFRAEFSSEKKNVDTKLKEKLYGELPGILNLILKGYARLVKHQAFTDAKASKKELDTYKNEMDHGTTWIHENVHTSRLNGGAKWAAIPELYQAYRNEMVNGGEKPLSSVHFGRKLSMSIPDYSDRMSVKKVHGKSVRVLLDCTFSSTSEV